jgi:DNA-binding NtrC family response regulator
VRELENLIERAIVLADGVALSRMDFPEHIFEPEPVVSSERTEALVKGADPGMQGSLEEQVARLETTLIQAALKKTGGNKSAAARELGLTERAIRYKIRKYGLE